MKSKSPSFRRGNKSATAALLAALLVSGAALTAWLVARTDGDQRDDLLQQARLLAQAVDIGRVQALAGTAEDLAAPDYARLKAQLAAVRTSTPQCRYIYLLGRKADGTVFFFADVGQKKADEAQPGKPYDDASEELRSVFDNGAPFVEGPLPDEWGVWVSALVPLTDLQTGAVAAVLGMDIDARDWKLGVLAKAALPPVLLLLTLSALLLLGSALLARREEAAAGVQPRWMRRVGQALAVAAGLALTLFITWITYDQERHARADDFALLAAGRTETIAEELRDLSSTGVEGLAHFYENSVAASPEAFRQFTSYLTKNRAIHVWEWAPAVAAADKGRFEQEARAAGMKDFEIWQLDAQGRRVPATGRAAYYPVFQAAPLAGNEQSLGYDLGSEPLRQAALAEAARTRLPTGTEPLRLAQETGSQPGMLICRPVFSPDDPARLCGYALAVLRMDTLLRSAAPDQTVLAELSLLREGAAPELLATSREAGDGRAAGLSSTRPVLVFGKVLAVTAHARPGFLRLHPVQAGWLAGLIGLALTATLTGVLRATLLRREELDGLVAERTRELRESETLQRILLDNLPVGVIIVDPETRVIERANHYVSALFGASAELLLGHRCHALLCPAEEGKCPVCDLGKSVDNSEREMVRADGSRLPVLKTVKRIQLYGREKLLECFVDVSERKRTEAALAQTSERLSLATRAGGVGVWDYDVVNNRLVWDDQMFRLYGIVREQFGGAYAAWQAGMHPEDRAQGDAEIQRALSGEKEFDTEFRVVWPDGSIHTIRALAVVQRDAAGKPLRLIGTNWDITVLRTQTAELANTVQELQLFNQFSINRELFMIDLKRQVNDLRSRLGEPPAFDLNGLEAAPPKDGSRT